MVIDELPKRRSVDWREVKSTSEKRYWQGRQVCQNRRSEKHHVAQGLSVWRRVDYANVQPYGGEETKSSVIAM